MCRISLLVYTTEFIPSSRSRMGSNKIVTVEFNLDDNMAGKIEEIVVGSIFAILVSGFRRPTKQRILI